MLENIQKILAAKYDLKKNRGVFISGFDEKNALLFSNGIVFTDKPLEEILRKLYTAFTNKFPGTKKITIDIIGEEPTLETDPQSLLSKNIKTTGLYMFSEENGKSGVLLPNTIGVENCISALQYIKLKNNIGSKAEIYSFTTERFVFSL